MNFIRVPSAGKTGVVLDAITASVAGTAAATGHPGFITVPVSAAAPNQPRPGIITTIGGFATLDDFDAFQEAALNNKTVMNRLDAIDGLCDRTHWQVSEVLSGALDMPTGYEAKVVGRTMSVAAPGKRQALVDEAPGGGNAVALNVRFDVEGLAGPVGCAASVTRTVR